MQMSYKKWSVCYINWFKHKRVGKKPEGAVPVATVPKEAKAEAKSETKSESKPEATIKPLKIETSRDGGGKEGKERKKEIR